MPVSGEQLKQFPSATATQDADLIYTSQSGSEAATTASQFAAYANAKVNPANLTFRNTLTGAEKISLLQSGALVYATITDLTTTNATRETFLSGSGFTPGVTTSITLAGTYGSINNIGVYFDDSAQFDCTLVGKVLTFNPVVPVGVQAVNITGGSTRTIGTPSAGTVGDPQLSWGNVLNRVTDSIAGLQSLNPATYTRAFVTGYYAAGDGGGGSYCYSASTAQSSANGGTIIAASGSVGCWLLQLTGRVSICQFGAIPARGDVAPQINAAMAIGAVRYAPAGVYPLFSTVTLAQDGGIVGDGEATLFQRNFTGGRLFAYPGGNPVYLSDFQVACAPSITSVNGDTGIDLGYSVPWAGRGLVANLLISGQWDGFKWTAGTSGSISNVQCLNNLGNGFYGINPRMEFYDCLSQENAGNGYLISTTVGGQTGVCFTRCGTFANQGYGHVATAGAGLTGANINWISCTSSFDGEGGFFVANPYLQICMTQILSEYSGNANQFVPSFSSNNTAVGIQINNSTYLTGSDIQALNCAGAGILLAGCTTGSFGQVITNGNGTGLQGGSNQTGILFNSNNVDITVSGLIANTGGTQTTDISVGVGNTINLVSPIFRTYSNSGNSLVRFVGRETTATASVVSSSALQLLDYYDIQIVSGTTNISNISSNSWIGRTITLIFTGALTVSNAGNIHLTAPFTSTANSTLTLIFDGNNWYGK